jgi:hypothetical protein
MPQIYTPELIGVKQCVVDEILLLDPYQIPLITALGLTGSGMMSECASTKCEWFEDQLYDTHSTATAAALVGDTQITVANVEPYRPNQIIKIGDELLLVTGVDSVNKKITVVRGYAETTAAAIAQNADIEVLFVEGVEGADAREARYKPRVPSHNITQIFDDTVDISGTAEAVQQYGIDDLYEAEKQKKQLELALQLEKALIDGIEYNNSNTRMMRGIRNYIETNVTDAGTQPLTIDTINDLAQEIYTIGGFKEGGNYTILVGPKQKRVLSKLLQDKIYISQNDTVRGQVTNSIVTDFGQFGITLDINLKPDELFLTDKNRMSIMPLRTREFSHTFLGKKGDHTQGQIVGEYTLQFMQEKAHGRIKNLQ